MLKNNKGISVITLIITIVVLLIITSITVFTGMEMVSNSREKAIKDRLQTIYRAIIAHEDELGYGDTVTEKQITAEEYAIMNLSNYADEDEFTPVYVSKKIDDTSPRKRIYNLKALRKKDTDDWYETGAIEYETDYDNIHAAIEFDAKKGVNRPQIIDAMTPISTYIDEDGDIRTIEVKNVYTEDWYDYSFTTPRWANMVIGEVKNNQNGVVTIAPENQYVWIPRFAYKIQDFYLRESYKNVPNSAISIIFLRENSNYMANGEILPDGYEVHPAFTYKGQELAGIWVAKYLSEDVDSLQEALEESEEMHMNLYDLIESHLMRNSEWAAMAYLSFVSGGKSTDGNTLNNSYGICDTNDVEFVAAGLDGANMFGYVDEFDIYSYSGTTLTYESAETNKNGDALIGTSAGKAEKENSAWFEGKSIVPTAENPYILRRGDISFFAYDSFNGTRLHTTFRNVLII